MKKLNIKPGPSIGKVLEELFKEVDEDLSLNRLELGKNGWENTIEYTVDESSLNNSYLTMIGLCKQRYGLTEDTPYNACIDRIIEDLENLEESHLRDSSRDN